jgi:hypothetical protein
MAGIYNNLPDILEASAALNRLEHSNLLELSLLLTKYGLQSRFGISLVHRHFDLAEGEELVDLISVQTRDIISTVFTNGIPDDRLVDEYNLLVPRSPTIVPSMLLVRESELIPYEYNCAEADTANLRSEDKLDEAFLSEWVKMLEKLGMPDRFGLAVLDDNQRTPRLEKSYRDKRVNITRECSEGDLGSHVPTVWYVAGDGAPAVCSGCNCASGSSG